LKIKLALLSRVKKEIFRDMPKETGIYPSKMIWGVDSLGSFVLIIKHPCRVKSDCELQKN